MPVLAQRLEEPFVAVFFAGVVSAFDDTVRIQHENVARLQESYYTNLKVLPVVDRPYEVAWAVRKNAPALWNALNAWIDENPTLARTLLPSRKLPKCSRIASSAASRVLNRYGSPNRRVTVRHPWVPTP